MHNHLQRIMNLVRRTGDRVIVTDGENPDESFVLMSLDDYELLMEDRFEEISRLEEWESEDDWNPATLDISDELMEGGISTEDEDAADDSDDDEDDDAWQGELPPEAYAQDDSQGPDGALDSEAGYGTIRTANQEPQKKRKRWQIPPEVKRGSEAVEEDRYYLENV